MNTPTFPYDTARLSELAQLLIDNVRELAQAGWTPATSSNFSTAWMTAMPRSPCPARTRAA